MNCTRCDGTGFLDLDLLPDELVGDVGVDASDPQSVLEAIGILDDRGVVHDVSVCDCCGDGDGWYGTPGEHYGPDDPAGTDGPYAYNGGLCECH